MKIFPIDVTTQGMANEGRRTHPTLKKMLKYLCCTNLYAISHVGWAKSFSCPPSSLKKWWATKIRCPPYLTGFFTAL